MHRVHPSRRLASYQSEDNQQNTFDGRNERRWAEMMHQTAEEVARWKPHGVKIHNLYAVKRTELAKQVESGEVRLLELDEYLEHLADFIERMPGSTVIERISGDSPPESLIAPEWCLHKGTIKSRLIELLQRRGTLQGSWYSASSPDANDPISHPATTDSKPQTYTPIEDKP